MRAIDGLIEERRIDAPEPSSENTDDGAPQSKPALVEISFLDLNSEVISSIVWASGFRCNFDWIDLPVLDPRGYPRQNRGVTPFPGLYFCGLHWMYCLKSGLFFGVGKRLSMSQVISSAEIEDKGKPFGWAHNLSPTKPINGKVWYAGPMETVNHNAK